MARAAFLAVPLLGINSPGLARNAEVDTFTSGGMRIAVERYGRADKELRPAVLLLHGSDGSKERYRAVPRQLAAAGYAAFLVHYLDRTGETRAALGAVGRHLPLWAETTRDAVSYA